MQVHLIQSRIVLRCVEDCHRHPADGGRYPDRVANSGPVKLQDHLSFCCSNLDRGSNVGAAAERRQVLDHMRAVGVNQHELSGRHTMPIPIRGEDGGSQIGDGDLCSLTS